MRSYTVATAALALDVSPKWLDNTLSHHRVVGVIQARQGISRRLTPVAALTLHIAVFLTRELAIPLRTALELASRLASAESGSVDLPSGLRLSVDISRSSRDITARLAEAVEVSPLPRRGRPRGAGPRATK